MDFLHESGQSFWQILPTGPTSYGDSPYAPLSVHAGNPYFIDLSTLIAQGYLQTEDCKELADELGKIDYEKQYRVRYPILKKAFCNAASDYREKSRRFLEENRWVEKYARYMAAKVYNHEKPWYEWETQEFDSEEKEFWIFLQTVYYEQYLQLKGYANAIGIEIIGDIPIYAAYDSSDVWSDPKQFLLDEKKQPFLVAGVPPDYFSTTGQLWGNPLYDWGFMKQDDFSWWKDRLKWSLKLYDMVRIDHFRGFDEFWAVPYGSVDATKGKWMKAEGRALFAQLQDEKAILPVIAEDLGIITERVIQLRKEIGLPGMKVLQFAFDGNPDNPHLPENFEEDCVAYTGTHDNNTLRAWYEKLDEKMQDDIKKTLKIEADEAGPKIIYEIIRVLYESRAKLCIIPFQDFLGLGEEARINRPSTQMGNWIWRTARGSFDSILAAKIKKLTGEAGRSA